MLYRIFKVTQPVMGPAQTVDDISVCRAQRHGALNQSHGTLQVHALLDPRVPQIIQHQRLIGLQFQCMQKIRFGARPLFGALQHNAARVEK